MGVMLVEEGFWRVGPGRQSPGGGVRDFVVIVRCCWFFGSVRG